MVLDAGMDDHVGKPIDRAELSDTIAHWLAPMPASPHPVFNHGVFGEIHERLGPVRTGDTLRMFSVDLQSRLCAGGCDVVSFPSDAHVVTSISGILGFLDLSWHCTEIAAHHDGGAGYHAKVLATVRAKKQALAYSRDVLSLGTKDVGIAA